MSTKRDFRPELLHKDFTLCNHPACPRSAECLRRLAYDHSQPFDYAMMVDVRRDPTACPHFRSAEVVQFARGFRRTMGELRRKDKRSFHWELQDLFACGERRAYKYINGEIRIPPEVQSELLELCRRYGVELHFDAWEEGY